MKITSVFLFLATVSLASSQTDVLTQHNDNDRTGAVLTETQLTPRSVASHTFHLLYTLPVDGQIYAQPLVISNVAFPTATRDLLIVATAHNTVYCFDNTSESKVPLWSINLGPSVPYLDVGSDDMKPEIGIVSTPVIDRASNTLWVVAKTKESHGKTPQASYFSRLHAIDLLTGREKPGSPVVVQGSVPGQAPDGKDGVVSFNSLRQMNRPGLLLDRGIIYLAFASHGDYAPYHGWVFAYDATNLKQVGIYNTTPDGDLSYYIPSGAGGIWMAGQGLACDPQDNVYFMSGNGAFSHDGSGRQTGNSFGKLLLGANGLTLQDFFTPHDSDAMNNSDADLGSAGVLLIPGTSLLLGGGKAPSIFLVDRNSMGGFSPTNDNIVQRFDGPFGGLFASPVYFDSPTVGPVIFTGGVEAQILAYPLVNGLIDTTPSSASPEGAPWPGSVLAISANGQSGAILWASQNRGDGIGVLRAFDANNLGDELWNSEASPRDQVGLFAKFLPPTIANGKLFLGTFSHQLDVYGLSPTITVRPSFRYLAAGSHTKL